MLMRIVISVFVVIVFVGYVKGDIVGSVIFVDQVGFSWEKSVCFSVGKGIMQIILLVGVRGVIGFVRGVRVYSLQIVCFVIDFFFCFVLKESVIFFVQIIIMQSKVYRFVRDVI